MKRALKLDPKDNVAIDISEIIIGDKVEIDDITIEAIEDIGIPHKIAIVDIKKGEDVLKYGEVLGYATEDIKKGQHVHVHNVDSEKLMK